jgi:hypothetical protein
MQIFPKLSLAETWKIKSLSPKKFGFVVFPDLAACATVAAPQVDDDQKRATAIHNTIPSFPKENVAARGPRASPARSADRSTIVSPMT